MAESDDSANSRTWGRDLRAMARAWAVGIGIAIALLGAASGMADEQADKAAEGKRIVETNCMRCHATGMDDKSAHDKAPPFRDVVERYPSENLAEALAEGIVSGHPDMPVFVFNPPQIEAFLAYLNSLERPKK